ncbi:MAG TPA: hypothetical protein VF109_10705 [Mycobacteriales bacterium]
MTGSGGGEGRPDGRHPSGSLRVTTVGLGLTVAVTVLDLAMLAPALTGALLAGRVGRPAPVAVAAAVVR